MFFNFFKRKSKTKNELSDNSIAICFKDLKGTLVQIYSKDNYLVLSVNNQICYINKEQTEVFIEIFKRFVLGESITKLAKDMIEKEEE